MQICATPTSTLSGETIKITIFTCKIKWFIWLFSISVFFVSLIHELLFVRHGQCIHLRFVVALAKLLFRLMYHSNVMLLTTILTSYNKPIHPSIRLSTFHHFLVSFLYHFPLLLFIRCLFLSLLLSTNSMHSLLFLWQPPSLKMLTLHAEYMLCVILWHWMIDFQDYTHTDDSIPVSSLFMCMCYGFCNWIQSDFLQFAFVPFLNLFHSFCACFWRWHLSHFVLKTLMFRYKIFTRSFI